MTPRFSRLQRAVLLALLGGLLLLPARSQAEPVPGKQDRMVIQLVTTYLQRGHLVKPEINEDLSRRLFQRVFKTLDPSKLYFLKADIAEFKNNETSLGEAILRGDVEFAYKVYERFVTRVGQRQKLIEELVNANHDFTTKEYLETDFDAIDYPKGDDELRERWRKRIKFDLLVQRLDILLFVEAGADHADERPLTHMPRP